MEISPQASVIPRQTRLASLLLALAACNAPERPSAPVHVNLPAPAPAPAPASSSSEVNATPPVSAAPALPSAPVLLPAVSSASASPARAPLAPVSSHRYVIAAIGDSLTDPRSHGGGYLAYLKTRCPTVEIDNFGKGGTMLNQMRRIFDNQVAVSAKHYTHLIVFGGVNDLYSDLTAFRTPAKIEADLGYMYAWGKAHELQVIALTIAPWGAFKRYFNPSRSAATQRVNAWIRAQPQEGHVDRVVDAYALLSCGEPERLCERFSTPFQDGIHFGPVGHEQLGQALFREAFSDCE
jgi:lysophospholipase L1-like esterase